jgi:hypothetical protein
VGTKAPSDLGVAAMCDLEPEEWAEYLAWRQAETVRSPAARARVSRTDLETVPAAPEAVTA